MVDQKLSVSAVTIIKLFNIAKWTTPVVMTIAISTMSDWKSGLGKIGHRNYNYKFNAVYCIDG